MLTINIFFFVLLLSIAQSADVYVSTAGSDTSECGSLQSPCETIDWGFTLCDDNCSLHLIVTQDGQVFEINEGGIFLNESISLTLSAYEYNDVYNAPTINMHNLSRAFTLNDNATLSLIEINFVSGYFPEGGGVVILTGTNKLNIDTCLFLLNQAGASQGGVIYSVAHSIITITNSQFYNNTASQGGAIYMTGGLLSAKNSIFNFNNAETAAVLHATGSASLDLEDCIFQQNSAGSDAGAVYASNSKIYANNLYFKFNTAVQDGAAIFLSGSDTTVKLSNSRFESNLALTGNGGGVFCENGAGLQVTNTSFEFNKAENGGAVAVTSYGAFITLNQCFISENEASTGGAVYSVHQGSVFIQDTVISQNQAQEGGGVYLKYTAFFTALFSDITENTAESSGGGIYCSGSTITLNETIVTNNNQFSPSTSDLYCYSSCAVDTYPTNSTEYVDPTWVNDCITKDGDDSSDPFLPTWAVILILVAVLLAIFGLIGLIVCCLWRGQGVSKGETVELLTDYDT